MGIISTIYRELTYLRNMHRILGQLKTIDPESHHLISDEIEQHIDLFTDRLAFEDNQSRYSYTEFEAYANRVAHWAKAQNCHVGDTIALFVGNRAEYVPLWFGLTKVGLIPALINFHLTSRSLAHCINISGAQMAIVEHDLVTAWESALPHINSDISSFIAFGKTEHYPDFDSALATQPSHRPDKSDRAHIQAKDLCMKMFTSGTTGLPKAAKITHVRAQFYMRGFASAAQTKPEDKMLLVLPMYHATGGLCAVGAAIHHGGAIIVRRKFSASQFWDDCVDSGATLFMYVGDLCRFLLTQPPHPKEHAHKLRWAIGNGLSPDIWSDFVKRFHIPHIIEFYGSTEGNISLMNVDGPVGAVGRIPKYLKNRFNLELIRYNVESDSHIRDENKFCLRPGVLEPGELIGKIDPDNPRFRFEGYETKAATEKKILRHVFTPDDMWFRSGDLLKRDKYGYYYFVDRIGDTYRWKSENVATGEVRAVLTSFKSIIEANVYSVKVPGYDGRAGMAALCTTSEFDLKALWTYLQTNLPQYARPVFLRFVKTPDTTSTFKLKKTQLVKEGFDPAYIKDPLYYAHADQAYQKITPARYQRLIQKAVKL